MRIARPGPGKGWRQTIRSGRPSSAPTARTSSLNSIRSGSTSSKSRSSGRPPTLWWDLIVAAPVAAAGLDHVRVERALDQEADVLELRRLLLEDADELLADDLALALGVVDARRAGRGSAPRRRRGRAGCRTVAEGLDDLLGLVHAHQAVVDEDAGELLADRPVDEQRRDRGVDAAGEAADHAARRRPGRGSRRPARRSPTAATTARSQPATSRRKRVEDLGAVAACGRPRGGTGSRRGRARATRRRRPASPGLEASAVKPGGGSKTCRGGSSSSSAPRAGPPSRRPPPSRSVSSVRPNSPASAALDPAAERQDHRLHPVTDAEHRDPELEQLGRRSAGAPVS